MVKQMSEGKISIDHIVNTYYQKIFKLSLFHLRDEQESEEVTQDIFLKVLKKLGSFEGQSDIYTWIYRIAINTVINYIKRKKLVQFLSFERISKDEQSGQNLSNSDPAVRLEKDESAGLQLRQLENAIHLLSSREKTAFYLFHYDNLNQKQIAGIMKTSVSAVESLVHKAKKKIRKNFADLK